MNLAVAEGVLPLLRIAVGNGSLDFLTGLDVGVLSGLDAGVLDSDVDSEEEEGGRSNLTCLVDANGRSSAPERDCASTSVLADSAGESVSVLPGIGASSGRLLGVELTNENENERERKLLRCSHEPKVRS